MIATTLTLPLLADAAILGGARLIDLAAFVAMGFVWLIVGGVVLAIYRILRSRARGTGEWGDAPGLN
ncbi:MAG: hypothetical protein H6711_20400 [Myxococcales bacterium]|nr:hypothetical protein [Myxococcales bacterium]